MVKSLEETYGPGVVPLPGRTTFYKLIEGLSTGRHTFGSAVTRRQTANRPDGPFTPTFATRPGEQVQIDSTPLDVMVLLDSGIAVRADLTIAIDVATRTHLRGGAAPGGHQGGGRRVAAGQDAGPGTDAAGMGGVAADVGVPAAARPARRDRRADGAGRRETSDRAGHHRHRRRPGVPVRYLHPGLRPAGRLRAKGQARTPTDKSIVEATFNSINTLLVQHLAAYTGSNVTLRGDRVDAEAVWTVPQLQDLLDEWLISGWQCRPHSSLRDPYFPRRAMSPNDMYASLVAAVGYLPLTLTGEDYLELLPVKWQAINDYGIRISYRTYDSPDLGPWRRQHSGITAKKGRWEIHYDPYDLSQVFVRTPAGWITVPWTHLPMVSAPFADFTWRHARRLAAEAGLSRSQPDWADRPARRDGPPATVRHRRSGSARRTRRRRVSRHERISFRRCLAVIA